MNRDRVLSLIRKSSTPLDDDQLAKRLDIEPRQSVNQICRRLASDGLIRRSQGPDGKIVNYPVDRVGEPAVVAQVDPETTAGPDAAGSSVEQRAAEAVILELLSEQVGVSLRPRRYEHPSGARVELDGASEDLTVLAECWAHQGPAKVAQKYKLVNDAVKLHWIAQSMPPSAQRLILCVSDQAAVRHLRGRSWQGQAIRELGVEIAVVELPEEIASRVAAAQKRQHR